MSVTDCRPCYSVSMRVAYLTRDNRAAMISYPHQSLGEFVGECERTAFSKGRKVEAISIVQSFSSDDLSRESAEDVKACHFAGQLLAEQLYPGVPALVVTHVDGIGGCLHNHLLVANNGSDGKAIPSKLRRHRTVAQANDEIMQSLSLSVIGGEAELWATRRQAIPERSFERELGDAVAAALAEGGIYSVDTYREALARHGVRLEEVPLKERGADGRLRVVTDVTGKPVVAGWRYAKRYSGDEGTPRKAMRRRRASNLCAEFTRESLQEVFERELANVYERRYGVAPAWEQQIAKERKETTMKEKSAKQLEAWQLERPAASETEADRDELEIDIEMPSLDGRAILQDIIALQGHPGYRTTAFQNAPGWKEEAEAVHRKGEDSYSSSSLDMHLRRLSALMEQEVESARKTFRASKEKREELASQGRTIQEWVLGYIAGRRRNSLVGILALVMHERLRLCREEEKQERGNAVYRSRAAMWDAEKRARAVDQAMRIYRRCGSGLPEYGQAYREEVGREIEARASFISNKPSLQDEFSL